MKLSYLLNSLDCKIVGSKNRSVNQLTHLAQECTSESVFFCLNGRNASGEEWAQTAIQKGCKVIVCEQSITKNKKITQIIVEDARKAMSLLASRFYGDPSKKLKIIGVTGTNGKTTTTHIIAHILKSKYKVGLIGTSGVFYDGVTVQTGFTTPDPIILHKILADMLKSGVEYVVMEYSAHAIYLQKLCGIMSYIVAYTNLSQDHLDYFKTMEQYFDAKYKLFAEKNYDHAVVCVDDTSGEKISQAAQNVTTCSTTSTFCDIFVSNKTHTTTNQSFDVHLKNQTVNFSTSLMGDFNVQNALIAIAVCLKCELSISEIAIALSSLKCVEGRFECYTNQDVTAIIDYAHTPDGLQKVLKTACDIAGKNRVICVFGCGGNRDTEKRKIMAAVAEKWADFSIITTDNPRYEDNFDIATDISRGFTKNKYQIVLDRGQAVRAAIDMCRSGDIVLIAGKGAEEYTEINGVKVPSSDKAIVKKVLNLK